MIPQLMFLDLVINLVEAFYLFFIFGLSYQNQLLVEANFFCFI